MIDADMTTRSVEVAIKGDLISKVNATTCCKDFLVTRGHSEFPNRSTAAIGDIGNLIGVVPQVFTHCINAVVRILPTAEKTNRDGDLLAQLGCHLLYPCIKAL